MLYVFSYLHKSLEINPKIIRRSNYQEYNGNTLALMCNFLSTFGYRPTKNKVLTCFNQYGEFYGVHYIKSALPCCCINTSRSTVINYFAINFAFFRIRTRKQLKNQSLSDITAERKTFYLTKLADSSSERTRGAA